MRTALTKSKCFYPATFNRLFRGPTRRAMLLLILLLSVVTTSLSAATPPKLLAHGAGDRYWYAVVQNIDDAWVTHSWYRKVQSGQWVALPDIPGHATLLSYFRSELLLVMDDGQWTRLSDQFVSGTPLPGRSPILAMAGGSDTLWAIVNVAPRVATTSSSTPTTASSTAPSVRTTVSQVATRSSTRATTSPTTLPTTPQLFEFTGGSWVRRAELPVAAQAAPAGTLSVAVVRGELQLAIPVSPKEVAIYRFDPATSTWPESARVPASVAVELKLMSIGDRAALWVRSAGDGPGALLFRSPTGSWSEPKRIKFESTAAMGAFSVAAAGDEVRVLGLSANGSLLEQKYSLGGEVTQPLAEVGTTHQAIERPGWIQMVVLAALGAFVLTNLSRRRPMQLIEINRVRLALAPLGLRLIAGLIDAIPVFIGLGWATFYAPHAASWQQLLSTGKARWVVLGSWGVYVLHTVLAELIWSRSLGKMFLGLRVVAYDGHRPSAQAIVMRNVLRLLDVLLSGFPLSSVFFSPLRQRLGDIPAATLVVVKLPSELEQKKSEPPIDLTPK